MPIADTVLLERLIGREALERLVELAGGLAVHVPKSAPLGGLLAELPPLAQEQLAKYVGGDVLYIPKCDARKRAVRDAAIVAAYDAGATVKALARSYGMSERWVYEILGRPQDDTRQGALF